MDTYKAIRQAAYECNMELYKHRLAIYTFGNASAADHDNRVFAIKPSGVPYDKLTPQNMVIVGFDGKTVEGDLRPSSDTRTHAVLYRAFGGIGGVVHTHSPYAVGWAQAQQPVPIFGTTHADHLAADIPCTPLMDDQKIKGDYEEETGNLIVETFDKLSFEEIPMVLVAGHGPFTWGKTADKAVYNSVMCEELAKMALFTVTARPDTPRLKTGLVKKHYERKHGKDAYYGQN